MMVHLSKQNIQIGFDDNWIQMKREKTQRQISIPIGAKKSLKISDNHDTVFPSIQQIQPSSITGIEVMTHHIARKLLNCTTKV
jgi:hypothetical protein